MEHLIELEERTPQEIADLKHDWIINPNWDLEYTPGFEAHQYHLRQFRLKYQSNKKHNQSVYHTAKTKGELMGISASRYKYYLTEKKNSKYYKFEAERILQRLIPKQTDLSDELYNVLIRALLNKLIKSVEHSVIANFVSKNEF